MPLQVIATEGVFTPDAEKALFRDLTELLLRLNGLAENPFLTPNVIGEINLVPRARTFAGGVPSDIVVFELKVPSIVLPTRELQLAWIREATDLLVKHAQGNITKEKVWGNVTHAVDGLWGIAGHAYTNEELGAALTEAAAV